VIGLSDQSKTSTPRKSDTRLDSTTFDQPLFDRKLQELVKQTQWDLKMGRLAVFDANISLVHEIGEASLMKLVDTDIGVLRNSFVPGIDKACRDVQRSGGDDITSVFIRDELFPRVLAAVNERQAETRWTLETIWARNGNRCLPPVLAHLLREMDDLENALNNRYDREIGQLERQESQQRLSDAKRPKLTDRERSDAGILPARSSGQRLKRFRRRKKRKLTDREVSILAVLRKGKAIGIVYCYALELEKIPPRKEWIDGGCPSTYPEAYKIEKWRPRIQDEKYRLSQFLPKKIVRNSSPTSATRRKRVNP